MAYGIETGVNGRFVYLDIRVEAGFLCRVRVLQEFGARRNRFFFRFDFVRGAGEL